MSDERLRKLQRAVELAPDSLSAKVSLLTERIRLGHVDPERIPVAAFSGDLVAAALDGGPYTDTCQVCDRPGIRWEGVNQDVHFCCARCLPLHSWLLHLESFGHSVLLRAIQAGFLPDVDSYVMARETLREIGIAGLVHSVMIDADDTARFQFRAQLALISWAIGPGHAS